MKGIHNESGDCFCMSCIGNSEANRTSPKQKKRIGSRTSRLHYGNRIRPKDKQLLDKLVAARKEYDKLRSKLLSSDTEIRVGRSEKDGDKTATVLELIKLVDKGEVSEHNALAECCSCCICKVIRGYETYPKDRAHGARKGRATHRDTTSKQADPCTCTLKLSKAMKKKTQKIIKNIQNTDKALEPGEKNEKNIQYKSRNDEMNKTLKIINQSKSIIQKNNPDIHPEVVKIAKEKLVRESQAKKNNQDQKDKENNKQMKQTSEKASIEVTVVFKDSKTKLKENVDKIARKSVEKMKHLETQRQLAKHLCECPEITAEVAKMAKQSLKQLSSKVAENEPDKENTIHKSKAENSKMRKAMTDLAKKSLVQIKKMDDNWTEAISKTKISLKRRKLESMEKLTTIKQIIKIRVKKSSKALTKQIRDSKIRVQKNVSAELIDRLGQILTPIEKVNLKKQNIIRKTKTFKSEHKVASHQKILTKDYEYDPPCFPEECKPQECYEKILLRKTKMSEIGDYRETDISSSFKLKTRLNDAKTQFDGHLIKRDIKGRTRDRKNKRSKAISVTIRSNHKRTLQRVDKKRSSSKATRPKPTFSLKVGLSNKHGFCKCDVNNLQNKPAKHVNKMTSFDKNRTKSVAQGTENRKTRSVNSVASLTIDAKVIPSKKTPMKSARLPILLKKGNSSKIKKAGRRNVDRINSSFNVAIEIPKLNMALKEADNVISPEVKVSKSGRNINFLKNEIRECQCNMKMGQHGQDKHQRKQNKVLSKGISVKDNSHIMSLKSTATATNRKSKAAQYNVGSDDFVSRCCIPVECTSRDCQTQVRKRRYKYKNQSSSTFNRKTKSTSSFTSRSVKLAKPKKIQSMGTLSKNSKQVGKKKRVTKDISDSGSYGRPGTRIKSNFSFSIDFSKENHLDSRKPSVYRKHSQGDGNMRKSCKIHTCSKNNRYSKSSVGFVTSRLPVNQGTTLKPILKRCFCSMNLSSQNRRKYTVSRMTVLNQHLPTSVKSRPTPLKSRSLACVRNISLLGQIMGFQSYPEKKYKRPLVPNIYHSKCSLYFLRKTRSSNFNMRIKSFHTFSASYLLNKIMSRNENKKRLRSLKHRKTAELTKMNSSKRHIRTIKLPDPLGGEYYREIDNESVKSLQCKPIRHLLRRTLADEKLLLDLDRTIQITRSNVSLTTSRKQRHKPKDLPHNVNPFESLISKMISKFAAYRKYLLPYTDEMNDKRRKEGETKVKAVLMNKLRIKKKNDRRREKFKNTKKKQSINKKTEAHVLLKATYRGKEKKYSKDKRAPDKVKHVSKSAIRDHEHYRKAVRICSDFILNDELLKHDQYGPNEKTLSNNENKQKRINSVETATKRREKDTAEYDGHRHIESQICHQRNNTKSSTEKKLHYNKTMTTKKQKPITVGRVSIEQEKKCYYEPRQKPEPDHINLLKKCPHIYIYENFNPTVLWNRSYDEDKLNQKDNINSYPNDCSPNKNEPNCLKNVEQSRTRQINQTKLEVNKNAQDINANTEKRHRFMYRFLSMILQHRKSTPDTRQDLTRVKNNTHCEKISKTLSTPKISSQINYNQRNRINKVNKHNSKAKENHFTAKESKCLKNTTTQKSSNQLEQCSPFQSGDALQLDPFNAKNITEKYDCSKLKLYPLKFNQQTMPQQKQQKVVTVGRVTVEDGIRNDYRQEYKPEMETIFPYRPRKFAGTVKSIRWFKHGYDGDQRIICHKKLYRTPSITNLIHQKSVKTKRITNRSSQSKPAVDTLSNHVKKRSDSKGIRPFLKQCISLLLLRKNTVSQTRLNLRNSEVHNSCVQKGQTKSTSKITNQKRQHKKPSKNPNSKMNDEILTVKDKWKSLKVLKFPSASRHRINSYCHFQPGDGPQIHTHRDTNLKNNSYGQCQSKSVGFHQLDKTTTINSLPENHPAYIRNSSKNECITTEKNIKDLVNKEHFQADPMLCGRWVCNKKTMKPINYQSTNHNGCLCTFCCPRNNLQTKNIQPIPLDTSPPSKISKTQGKSGNRQKNYKFKVKKILLKTKIKKPKSRNENEKYVHEPLFEIKVDSSNYTVINKDETISNIIEWKKNMEILRKRDAERLKLIQNLKKHKRCRCGSEVCRAEMNEISDKVHIEQESLSTRPCICGSKVCAVQATKTLRGRKRHAEAALKQKTDKLKKKQQLNKKQKTQQKKSLEYKRKKIEINKQKKEEKKKRKQIIRQKRADKINEQVIIKAEKRRYRRHLKRARKLNRNIKSEDPNRFLITDSIVDLSILIKTLIESAAQQAYRVTKSPSQTLRKIKHAMTLKLESRKAKKKKGYNTASFVAGSTFRRIGKRMAFTTCGKNIVKCLTRNKFGHMLLRMGNKKNLAEFKRPRRITDADRAANCNVFLATLRKRPCVWVYDRCPSFYPHCLTMLKFWRNFANIVILLLAIVVWSPCIFCMEICRGLMCCTFCTQ